MDALSPGHLVVIAVVAFVLFFCSKQLPDVARSVGRSLRIFKTELSGLAADNEARTAISSTVDDARAAASDAVTAVRPAPTHTQLP